MAKDRCVACGVEIHLGHGALCDRCWKQRVIDTIDAAVERATETFNPPDPRPAAEEATPAED
ncbi:MAG: hypothetical protein ACYS99_12565 [Planctomycetota bacterium]|jgi:hypothetical protein